MFEFLGTVFFIFLAIVIVVVVALIAGFVKIMRAGKSYTSNSKQQGYNDNSNRNTSSEKHFSKDEGEYVDFEELKDDK